jgi:4-amino-4-deoxy-L-arabinose transferase-like glycosyltransferase
VTSSSAEEADRSSAALSRSSRAGTAAPALLLLLLLGLMLRLTIAYLFLPGSGFSSDIGTFAAWAIKLGNDGPGDFYATVGFADYPPGYLYVLWLIGGLGNLLSPTAGGNVTSALIKLPAMLADIGVAFVLFHLVRGWVRSMVSVEGSARADRLGLIAAGIYLFNPVTWYDSAIWGQTDAVGALVILLGLAALIRGNSEGAFGLAVLSALVKPQFGIVLGSLVVIVLLKRHLFAPGSGPQNRPLVPGFLRSWFEEERGPWRLLSSLTVGMIIVLALITPFGLDLRGLIELLGKAAGGYEYLTVNAYNLWALVGSGGRPGLAFGGGWSPDTVPLFGPLPGIFVGAVLLIGGFVIGWLRAAWRDDRRSLLIVAVFLALAFFMLPTRVHERYLFPVFAILPALAVLNRRWVWITIALSIASFINLHGILTTPLYATDNLMDLPLGEFFRETPGVVISVLLHLAAFVLVALQLRPSVALEEEDLETTAAMPPLGAGARGGAVVGAGTGLLAASMTHIRGGTAVSVSADSPPSQARLLLEDVRTFFRPVLNVIPVRRDRSAELAVEPGGRLDRLDLLLLVLVFLAALGLRTLRLEQPFGMHFDEVYHARTATEFLQDWRYGIPHSIYEYTHPHMAKYLIAEGIEFFGDNQVVASTDLGTSVKAAAIERRWAPTGEDTTARDGDRVYVVGSGDVRAYDLASRAEVATITVSADALAVDETGHVLYLANSAGSLWRVATDQFDQLRTSGAAAAAAPGEVTAQPLSPLANLAGRLTSLTWTSDRLVGLTDAGMVLTIDPATGAEISRTTVEGAVAVAGVDAGQRLVLDMTQVTNLESTITNLATFASGDVNEFRARAAGRTGRVVLQGYLDDTTDITDKITAAGLTGATVEAGQALAVAGGAGVVFVDAETLDPLLTIATDEPISGMTYVDRAVEKPTLYAASGSLVQLVRVPTGDKPSLGGEPVKMPGPVSDVLFNPATELVHVLGRTADGSAPTVYVIEPHANAVFADAQLAFEPSALVMDTQPRRPADNRNDILAFSATGTMATVDVGSNAYAWRFMGVLAGALMAMCIYLLARFLFRRRSVAVFAAVLLLLDGMAFANARIAMNDTYVAFFIVAAVTVFAPIWLGRWRSPLIVGPAIVAVGVLLGLALASKWVGAYALGGILLLILLRSALGRIIALFGMVVLTAVLGYLAIQPDGNGSTAGANITFLVMMIVLTCLLAVAMALRPVGMSKDEFRFAVLGPFVLGVLLILAGVGRSWVGPVQSGAVVTPTLLFIAGGFTVALGVLAFIAFRVAARFDIGPLAPRQVLETGDEPAADPPAPAWLRPGGGLLGVAWIATLGALVVIPLAIYVASYIPWVAVGGRWTDDNPTGHPGQTFIQLQLSMYDYHNNLRATHPASSPWWAWPLDLKPVWFEQADYAAGTASSIYDSGNVVIFWLAIPAFAFLAYQAWRRRSLALTFVAIMVLSMWLPWVRIDRATFQYHFFTTLPFTILGLGYFLAELWHGPSRRTWLLARVSAAIAILGPALLWVLRQPLCGLAGTQKVNANSEACGAATRQLVLTDLQVVAMLVAIGALVGLAWLIWWPSRGGWLERNRQLLVPIALVTVLAGLVLALVGAVLPGTAVFQATVGAFELPLLFVLLSAIPAYYVLRARDARRFAVSAVAIAALWFILWYPTFSGLPIPSAVLTILNNALSPTYNWGFQFAVNQAPPSTSKTDWIQIGLLASVLIVLCAAAFYAARQWRTQRAEERTLRMASEAG